MAARSRRSEPLGHAMLSTGTFSTLPVYFTSTVPVLRTRTTCTGYYCSIIECCTWPVLSPGFLGFFSTLFLFASLLARTRTRRETWSCTHMEVPGCLLKPPPLGRAGRRYSSVVVAGTDPGPRVSSLQLLSRLGCPLQLGSAP